MTHQQMATILDSLPKKSMSWLTRSELTDLASIIPDDIVAVLPLTSAGYTGTFGGVVTPTRILLHDKNGTEVLAFNELTQVLAIPSRKKLIGFDCGYLKITNRTGAENLFSCYGEHNATVGAMREAQRTFEKWRLANT